MGQKSTTLLEVRDLHTHYGDSHVLQGVSLEVPEGAVVALLGRNGVGKTTLVHTVAGFLKPTSGEVLLSARRIGGLAPERIANLGVSLVPQGRRIFSSLRVNENIHVAERKSPSERSFWSLMTVYDGFPLLSRRWRQPAGKLSGGEQQALATARALVRNAKLIMMDEPSEGLAPFLVEQLAELINQSRREGKGVLLVEQKLGFALRLADNVYIMSRGQVVYRATPSELDADTDAKARFLGV